MKRLKLMPWVITSLFLLLAAGCVTLPEFDPTYASLRRARSRGEIKEALASYESQAQEAENNAAVSWFPQKYWEAATGAYAVASRAAWLSGQLQKSIAYAEKARELAAKSKEPRLQLEAVIRLSDAYAAVRNFDQARELIEKGFQILESSPVGVGWMYGDLYDRLGFDLMRRGEYEKAVDALSQAVYMTRDRELLIARLTSLGNAYRRAGKLQEALEQYQSALNSIKGWGRKNVFEGNLYQGMGDLYLQQKNFPLALENFQKALALAEGQRRPTAIRLASARIGDILRQTGKPAEAVPYYLKAIHQIESVRSLLEHEEYRQSYFGGAIPPYLNIIQALLLLGREGEAFDYSERVRSRVFLDVLGSRVQLSRVRGGLLEEERALQERIASIKAGLVGEERSQEETLRRELAEAEKAYNVFLAKVRKQDKEQASLMTVEPLTLKEVQELLDPGTTLVEYFVTGPEVFVWVVEKNKLQFQRVELPKDKLSGLVKTLRESIFTLGERDKLKVASTLLYGQLFEPLLPFITGKELIIVPHDVLHYLPFHALLSPDSHYLIEKYPIYYLSSASLLQFVKEKRKAKGEKVLAFANPDLGDPNKDLQFAELEAREVQSVYPQSTVLLRKEATEEKGKALSPQHDILHFATHAELKEDDPLSSAILLSKEGKEDGRLEVREIFGMNLNANLVVLSGCETGLGKLSSGDELVGLTRAFIYAGTPSVVASLWKVDDDSTAALMGSFYRNLKSMSKVEALRQAQLEMIRGEGRSDLLARRGVGGIGKLGEVPEAKGQTPISMAVSTSHPYFWAPFILVGDGK